MYPVIDLHCDTIPNMYAEKEEGKEISLLSHSGMIDLEKMRAGGYWCQCFSLFTNLGTLKEKGEEPFDHVDCLSDFWIREVEAYPEQIRQVTGAHEIEENTKAGRLSAMMTVEEGAVYEGKLENLYTLYEKGVRMSTLTWNFPNELGYPNPEFAPGVRPIPDTVHGLTDTGRCFVEEMERLGVIIDLSHLNDAGIRDVLDMTKGPVIASHSNARALCPHLRNLPDEAIRRIGEKGGIIGINYLVDFLEEGATIARVDRMAQHMDYIRNLAGIEAIALGSDFDGFEEPCELDSADKLPLLAQAMERRGFKASEIEKVFAGNALRLFGDILD